MKSSLDKIFYKILYHHIIYMCDFFVNLKDFFTMICTSFHEDCGFHKIRLLSKFYSLNHCLESHLSKNHVSNRFSISCA